MSKISSVTSFWARFVALTAAVVLVFMPLHAAFAASYITLNSFSGHPTTLQVSGGGWNAGETVSIYLGNTAGTRVAAAIVGGDTFFGPIPVTIPANTPQGPLSIIGVGSQTQSNSYYVVPFDPSIASTNAVNTPGGVATFSGNGFAPNETVNFITEGINGGHVTADATGSFVDGPFTIPFVAAGTHILHATGASSGADAINYFYIGGFYPGAYPSTYYLLPSQILSFSGGGFAPGETIRVFEGANPGAISSLTANASGAFTDAGGFTVPFSFVNSTRHFHLTGSLSHVTADTVVTVGQFFPAAYPSAYYVAPSDPLSFSGGGFAAHELVRVFDGANVTTLSSFTTDADGNFAGAGSFIVPYSFAGSPHTFRLVGSLSGATAEAPVTIGQFYPLITVSAYFINPGQSLTVNGSGFAPHETVDIILGAGVPVPFVADAAGTVSSTPLTVPFTNQTTLPVRATGETSHAEAAVVITLGTYYPTIVPSAYYVFPGDNISFMGTGFAPNETVTVTSGLTTLGTTIATPAGNITTPTYVVPFGAGGTKTYTFTGALSNAAVNMPITVAALVANATADTYYITPGSTVHVSGTGFSANEGITITGGLASVHTTANAFGAVGPTAVVMPFSGTANVILTLTGDSSGASAGVTITLAPFFPTVTPDVWYTNPGITIHFDGSGFASSETVSATLNGAAAGTMVATAAGTITGFGIPIPVSATTAHFVFTGNFSHASAAMDIGLAAFAPQVAPSTWYTTAGSGVSFTGTGFAGNETVSFALNGVAAGTAIANASGAFTSSPLTIPFSATHANFVVTSSVTNVNIPLVVTIAPLNPAIWFSTYYSMGGMPLTVNGSGFSGTENVNVTFDGAALGTMAADAAGNFALVTTVPYGAAGNKTIQAHGASSGANAMGNFTLPQVYVSLELGSYAGAPGDAVTFIGSGYLPNETINVTTNRTGGTIVHSFTAAADGTFHNSGYLIPASFVGGPLNLTVTGTHSFAPKSITYYVTGA